MLVLGVLYNLTLDTIHKHARFSKAFPKKNLKLVASSGCSLVMLDPGFMLLPANVDLILEEQGCRRDMFMTFSPNGFKIVLVLLTELIIFYM